LEEFANVRTILPKISSFLRLRIHSSQRQGFYWEF
jgi:hypothetical protein